MAVDVTGISGDVYGIVGTGISLGVLAGTTGMIMRSMERNVYGRPYRPIYGREEEEEEIEYRRPRPRTRTYQKRKKTTKRKTSKKRKTTRTYQKDEYEERPRYGTFSPYSYGSPRLNIPRYW